LCFTGCEPGSPSTWFSGAKAPQEPPSEEVRARLTPEEPEPARYHVVQEGETLAAIGRKYEVAWKAIARANKLADPNRLAPGQRILIPAPREGEEPYVREFRKTRAE
jgi:LysM repeat protein